MSENNKQKRGALHRRKFLRQAAMASAGIPLAAAIPETVSPIPPVRVKELRIVLTVDNQEELARFYRDTLGLTVSKEWHEDFGNGIILEAGKASLELIDHKDAEYIDQVEVGKRVAGPVRLAFNVGDQVKTVSEELIKGGAKEVAAPRQAPWSEVARLAAPDGMQITLFAVSTLFK